MVIHTEPWKMENKKKFLPKSNKNVLNQTFALKCEGVKLLPLKLTIKTFMSFLYIYK